VWAATAVVVESGSADWRERRIREWLLLLLRFAVTREPSDRAAALAFADELDSLGGDWRPNAPHFFLRTSESVCEAILWNGGQNNRVLLTHTSRIDDPRLRLAFRGAIGLHRPISRISTASHRSERKPQNADKQE
jgi:hypothetical protein